jgi:hypothetical protein
MTDRSCLVTLHRATWTGNDAAVNRLMAGISRKLPGASFESIQRARTTLLFQAIGMLLTGTDARLRFTLTGQHLKVEPA